MLRKQLQGSCLHVCVASDVRKLLTADVKVGGGGAIGHGGMGLYLQVGREWEGTWVKDRSGDAQMEREWMRECAMTVGTIAKSTWFSTCCSRWC